MSRRFIDSKPGILEDLIKLSGYDDIIGHKKYNLGETYFGKATGVNKHEGKNGTVIGTPQNPEWFYVLFARTIGWGNLFNIDKTAKLRYQQVKDNGFLFWFMTFDDEFLRHVQFWQISSDLLQSIGRFRASRYPVTINVFSSFPLRQTRQRTLPEHIVNRYKNKDKVEEENDKI